MGIIRDIFDIGKAFVQGVGKMLWFCSKKTGYYMFSIWMLSAEAQDRYKRNQKIKSYHDLNTGKECL